MAGLYTKYPETLDDSTSLPLATDNVTPVKAEVVNRLRDAILAIESELGLDPSREFGTVRARLDALLAGGGGTGSGSIEVFENGVSILPNVIGIDFVGSVNVSISQPLRVQVDVIGGQSTQVQETKAVTSDGQTTFTLSDTPKQDATVLMFLNGLKQQYGIDYTVSTTTVTWTNLFALKTTDKVEFWYLVDLSGLVSGGDIAIQDEGVEIESAASTINFIGAGVTAASAGAGVVNVTITATGSNTTVPVTNITNTDSPFLGLSDTYLIAADSTSGAIIINLPAGPATGRTLQIKDVAGTSATNNITINGNGANIDGSSSYVIVDNYESIMVTFTGTRWSIV